ncbi:MAG: hypothetical protein AVDCRST_MAG25-2026 [uncultured Rubrobacteraceae bacterium]|uniref:Uncharacterized protein n=1 Tax=uncultured Rubrobacteraceae bacterium TaxID=349277 RepID=A0A6J4REW0_9ACTN|nr:MAG: hypothetical protein AVDCRST_MAG25-2026 [uncultured Rubrobacteraceae bacterium]
MELRNKDELKTEILQSWLRSAWVYPMRGPEGSEQGVYMRLTPGGRLKMRRGIGELEAKLGVKGTELADQEEAGTLPAERDKLELAMMVQAYTSERRFIESQGTSLGTAAVGIEEASPEGPLDPAASSGE